ncbi:MAG: hypothetical protein CM15mP49_23290 [Actinomycetota bacterium]|nr:MAG: hypothetical protein CM15mP49_23290 [Actinomycetota bacterium]
MFHSALRWRLCVLPLPGSRYRQVIEEALNDRYSSPMSTDMQNLKKLNFRAGCLHLVSFVLILILSNDASLPVVATYLTEAPGTGNFSRPHQLIQLEH